MPDNSSSNKRIAKNTLLLYLRSLFLMLISLYTSRVILQSLGVEDYGIYNVIGGVVAMFSMLSSTMASASQRYITYAIGDNNFTKLRRVFTTSITLHVVIGIIVVLLIEIFGTWFLYNKLNIPQNRINIAFWVLQFSIATLFVNIIAVPFISIIIAYEKMSAFAYISILEGILKLLIALLLFISPIDKLLLYSALMFGSAFVILFIYTLYCTKHMSETKKIKLQVEKGLFHEMFSFMGWNLIGNGSLILRNQGIDILLNLFFGVTINAAKGICNQVQTAIYQLVSNFNTALNPQLTKAVAKHDIERIHFLIIQGGRFSFFLLCIFAIPIIITAPQLLSIWLVEVPPYSVAFVRWTMIYLLFDSLSRCLITSILSYGKIKTYEIVVGGTKLLALPMAYVWLRIGGSPLVGIWVNIILEVACLYLRLFFNQRYIRLEISLYIRNVILICWLVFLIPWGLLFLVRHYLTDNFILLLFISFFITALSIWVLGINKCERKIIIMKAYSMISK
ncbi:MAG: lipopolysaccharide biosynthesis protein [Bacteroidales bacterium]|nr:lipopolysaccharide biosynthesis protein [Bacteroidales bacterium]